MFDEVLDNVEKTPTAGESESRLLRLLCPSVHMSSMLHQQSNHLLMSLPRRLHQRSVAGDRWRKSLIINSTGYV